MKWLIKTVIFGAVVCAAVYFGISRSQKSADFAPESREVSSSLKEAADKGQHYTEQFFNKATSMLSESSNNGEESGSRNSEEDAANSRKNAGNREQKWELEFSRLEQL